MKHDKFLNLNWLTSDGIGLPMINDVVRNTFYDKILDDVVKDKHCCDVGFGTGFLSLLALKHGAKSVVAYEKSADRYELGQYLIKKLNLQSKITLINDLASTEHLESDNCDVIFHEIVHQALWGEGLWYIKPKQPGKVYAPGNYFLEIYASEISDSTVNGLINGECNQDYFNPGIDLPADFINSINNLILRDSRKDLIPVTQENSLFRTQWSKIHSHWSWNPMHVFSKYKKLLVAGYDVDYNLAKTFTQDSSGLQTLDFSKELIKLSIDTTSWKNKNIMVEVKFGLRHGQEKLYLDHCRNWGQEAPWLVINPTQNLNFTQSLSTGFINFCFVQV